MAVAYGNYRGLDSYRVNSVMSLSPAELVLKSYDICLSAISAGDVDRASRVLVQLIDCLDFGQGDVALGLFRLYRYCLEEIKAGRNHVPIRILKELRQTWATAIGATW